MKILVILILFYPLSSFADEQPIKDSRLVGVSECSGAIYRPKKDNTPVYDTGDLTSRVVDKLMLGQRVCYVGETGEFAIVAWDRADSQSAEFKKIAFVRRAELWQDSPTQSSTTVPGIIGIFQKAKRSFVRMFHGGVPEDPLAPYRPVIGSQPEINPCVADGDGCTTKTAESD